VRKPSSKDEHAWIFGARGIAAELRISKRKADHLLKIGAFGKAAKKVGSQWCTTRHQLRSLLEQEEGDDARATAP